MTLKRSQYLQITKFLSKFSILQHSQGSTVIASQANTYLIRNIEISNKQSKQELQEIINTLSQHQTFNSKNILGLVDFELVFNQTKTQSQIRAVYQYGRKSLAKQLESRKQAQQHFDEDAIWGVLYSIASPLAYLQERNIIYGVIDAQRIFLDNNNIAILDPSSTGIDPYQITPNRLFSPQLLSQYRSIEQIDMFRSDVFALGLLMLQCAMLNVQLYEYDENILKMCLSEIKDLYSENLCQMIEAMISGDASERPSFAQILQNMNEMFDISSEEMENLQSALPDREDQGNQVCHIDEHGERENIDILETQYVRFQDHNRGMNDFDQAKLRFCSSSRFSCESPINEDSEYSETSSLFIEQSIVKSFEKSRRIYRPKEIKQKLVKKDFTYHTQRDYIDETQFNSHRRTQSNWQKERSKGKQNDTIITKNQNNPNKQIELKGFQLKQNNPHNTNFSYQSNPPFDKQNLFTKPQIMNMIKNDMQRIKQKKEIKKMQQIKKTGINVHFNYVQYPEQKKNNLSFMKVNEGYQGNHIKTKSMHQASMIDKKY